MDNIIGEKTTGATATSSISLSHWIKEGFGVFKRYPKVILCGLLWLCVMEGAIEALMVIPYGDIAGMIISLLITPAYVGWMILCLKGLRGEQPHLGDIFGAFASFGPLIAAFILYLLMIVGGLALFVVPGFILALKFMFAGMALVDRDFNVAGAFRFSDAITKGYKRKLFTLFILCIVPGFAIMALALVNEHYVLETPWHPLYNFTAGFISGLILNLPTGLLYAPAYEALSKRHEIEMDDRQSEEIK